MTFNRRRAAANRRALFSDSKANRERYGVASDNAVFLLDENAPDVMDAKDLGKVLKMANAFGLDLGVNDDHIIYATAMGGYKEVA